MKTAERDDGDPQSLFENVKKRLCGCSPDLRVTPNVEAILKMPVRELHVSLPIRMDDGSIQVFQGFRVQYNDARGPMKGGVRYHPDQTIDTIRGLASIMTWKCALHNLPLGGATGGVICNPKKMSKLELERLTREYIQRIYHIIRPEDTPAPDVYTDAQTMAWMMDKYSKISQKTTFGVTTGKLVALGGSEGRTDATAMGRWYIVREAAREMPLPLPTATAVQQRPQDPVAKIWLAQILEVSDNIAESEKVLTQAANDHAGEARVWAGTGSGIVCRVERDDRLTCPAVTLPGAMIRAMLAAYRRTLEKTMAQARSMNQVVDEAALPGIDSPDRALVWSVALGLGSRVEEVLRRSLEDVREGRVAGPVYLPVWYHTGGPGSSGGWPGGSPGSGTGSLFSSSMVPNFGGMMAVLGTIGNAPSSSGGGGFGGGGSGGGGGGAGGGF